MSVESLQTEIVRPEIARYPFTSVRIRTWMFLTGVVMPTAGIACAFAGFKPAVQMWQSDDLWIYAAILLTWPTIVVVLPLIVPCILCMAMICIRPTSATNGFVRAGIYMGAALASLYFVIAVFCASWIPIIAGAMFGVVLSILLFAGGAIFRNWNRFSLAQLLMFTTSVCIVAATITYLDWQENVMGYLAFTAFSAVMATPALNALAYVWTSVAIYHSPNKSLSVVARFALLGSMIAAWYVSWRAAIDVMLDEYSRLPPQAGCYVCSAAAHGHGWFVRRDLQRIRGEFTNLQMRRCKFLEICLLCGWPRLHQRVRSVYDVVGPRLAKLCRCNVWFADATFLLLKPLEWTAELLRRGLMISQAKVRELY